MEFVSAPILEGTNNDKIESAIKGDKLAFSTLLRENYNTMYRISYSILKNEADIEDALQEATLRAFRSISKLKNTVFFKTWLIKIVINESCNILKKKKKHSDVIYLYDNEQSTEDNYENIDVRNAILKLEEELRMVVILFYYEDVPVKDIAEVLNIPEGTVKSRLSRARTKLHTALNVKEE